MRGNRRKSICWSKTSKRNSKTYLKMHKLKLLTIGENMEVKRTRKRRRKMFLIFSILKRRDKIRKMMVLKLGFSRILAGSSKAL